MKTLYIKNLLKKLDFKSDVFEIYTKKYSKSDYSISVDINNNKIIYGEKIIVGDKTTSNFSNPENLVVLECVDRLLNKGYNPEHLHLEKKWKLGRTGKSGKADINVYGSDGKTLLIIECKTSGNEYEKEIKKMEANGGQLFSYLQQDRDANFLCLYTSKLNEKDNIKYENAIVKIEDRPEDIEQYEKGEKTIKLYQRAKNNEQLYTVWKETFNLYFHYNGIFDDDVSAYSINLKPLKRRDLKELENSQGIFNKFAEILRHNNISDKSNAFNKVLSLFLCKVVDEEKNNSSDERVLDFQIIEDEDAEVLIDKLQALYQEGMSKYLNEEIVYFSDKAVSKVLKNFPRQTAQDMVLDIFKQVKYYTNQDFAFKEIHNKELFKQNSRILKEVIKLFQYYKFKYTHKEQILGNFFELLLSLGVKQSEGQFFTPVPITRFIVTSIPIKENILKNLEYRNDNFLPKVLDYACGSGHFLTESIDEIQQVIDSLDETKYYSHINEYIKHNKFKTYWAEEHIFGIEKDYRLARTAQIACLLNGDGEANIIFGDGLDSPEKHRKKVAQFPEKVDVIVANPPYSVKAFKNYLNVSEKDYSLFNYLTENSKEIETLFIEQTKKMLNGNGIAAVILPSSILKNTGLYTKTREIILRYFEIPAIVELGSKTFIATTTNTIILFLKRRNDHFQKNRNLIAEDFIFNYSENIRNLDFVNSKTLFNKFVNYRELKVDDYITLLERKPNEEIKNWDLYKYYIEWFDELTEIKNLKKKKSFKSLSSKGQDQKLDDLFYEKIFEKEFEKFVFFMLTMKNHEKNFHTDLYKQQKTVIIKTGEKEIEKDFLGYEKSERQGYEGIDFDPKQSKLFNNDDFFDPTKANSYIRKVLSGEEIDKIDESLKDHIKVVNLTDCLTFDNVEFEKQINTKIDAKVTYESKYDLKNIGSLVEIQSGLWTGKKGPLKTVKVLRNTEFVGNGYLSYEKSAEIDVEEKQFEKRRLKNNDILLEKSGGSETQNIGRVAFCNNVGNQIYSFSNFTSRLRPIDQKELLPKYLWAILNDYYSRGGTLLHQSGIRLKNLNMNSYKYIKIPVPPISIQKQIIEKIEDIENNDTKIKKEVEKKFSKINNIINGLWIDNATKVRIQNLFNINKKNIDVKEKYASSKFTYVDIDSVGKGSGKIDYNKQVAGDKAPSRAKRLAEDQTAIISTVRPYLKGFAFVKKEPIDTIFTTGFALINSKDEDKNLAQLLYYYFMFSNELMRQMKEKMPKSSYPSINKDDIDSFLIPEVKITNQKKIVSEIEKLEKEIEKLENSIKNTEQEKKLVLTKFLE